MTDLLVLCPTRGRPEAAREAYRSFMATRTRDSSEILFVIDDDDPTLPAYLEAGYLTLHQPPPGSMVNALNLAARWAIDHMHPRILGFIGDDHRFRTRGWDESFSVLLEERGSGLVYGNDLFWPKGEIPTQIFMSSEIVDALGWMGLPSCTHLFIDNAWQVIGEQLGRFFYMPDIVIEHMHPAGGKAPWDEGHLRVNSQAMYDHDRAAFHEWLQSDAPKDIERVRSTIGAATT